MEVMKTNVMFRNVKLVYANAAKMDDYGNYSCKIELNDEKDAEYIEATKKILGNLKAQFKPKGNPYIPFMSGAKKLEKDRLKEEQDKLDMTDEEVSTFQSKIVPERFDGVHFLDIKTKRKGLKPQLGKKFIDENGKEQMHLYSTDEAKEIFRSGCRVNVMVTFSLYSISDWGKPNNPEGWFYKAVYKGMTIASLSEKSNNSDDEDFSQYDAISTEQNARIEQIKNHDQVLDDEDGVDDGVPF